MASAIAIVTRTEISHTQVNLCVLKYLSFQCVDCNCLMYPDPTRFHGDNRLGSFTMTGGGVPPPYSGRGATYLGCYTDSSDREFKGDDMYSNGRNMTIFSCAQTCVNSGAR
jgi:hypothetical protein